MDWEIVGAWVAAGLTIFIFSFLYKDNPFYKIAEHLYLGVSLGYLAVQYVRDSLYPFFYQPLFEQLRFDRLIPFFLGFLVLLRIFPRLAWPSRISFALLIGFISGLSIPRVLQTSFINQAEATVKPLLKSDFGSVATSQSALFDDISQLIILAGVLSVLVYFFFSVEHKGVIGKTARVGIYFLMIYFGAAFGATVMGRLMLSYGRLYDLYAFTDGKYYYSTFVILAIVVVTLIFIRKKEA